MSKPLRYSRWRRLPGLHRITERRLPDHRSELQRLTLYLPGSALDAAERLALESGAGTVQSYCEDLLRRALESEVARGRVESAAALASLDAIASDPDYLAEWSSRSALERLAVADAVAALAESWSEPEAQESGEEASEVEGESLATEPVRADIAVSGGPPADPADVVFRHAAIGPEDPAGFLPTLRRGEPVAPGAAGELMQALVDLERRLRDERLLDRRLSYALHRLAFEGQVLLTDAWPNLAADQATVDVLRMIQEAVDRILSGEDIRYYAPGVAPESPP